MRIIGGELKGRVIKSPPRGQGYVRPVQDKIKGAIFNILQDKVAGANVLDLFAGSGTFGFESLSRGAQQVTFVESDWKLIRLLEENLRLLGLEERGVVLRGGVLEVIGDLGITEKMFDLIFSDPPYGQGLANSSLLRAVECAIVSESGFLITESYKKEELPEAAGNLVLWKRRLYGGTAVSFYKRVP